MDFYFILKKDARPLPEESVSKSKSTSKSKSKSKPQLRIKPFNVEERIHWDSFAVNVGELRVTPRTHYVLIEESE